MDHRRYYVIGTTSGEHGPYGLEELSEALTDGHIEAHDMVRTGLGTMIGSVDSLLNKSGDDTANSVDESGVRRASRSLRASGLIVMAVAVLAAGMLYAIRPTIIAPPSSATSGDSADSPHPIEAPLPPPAAPGPAIAAHTNASPVVTGPIVPRPPSPVPASAPGSYPKPLIEMLVTAGVDGSLPNSGSSASMAPAGKLTADWPRLTDKGPGSAVGRSLDFGIESHPYACDLPKAGKALESLRSFTISAWLNNRDGGDMYGGNRIVCWINHGHGVDLSYKHDGSLQLGINDWADRASHTSSPGMIPANKDAASTNWRFFAVTYDATISKHQVHYYFGSLERSASLDRTLDYAAGLVGANASTGMSIGHVSHEDRQRNLLSMFRGLIAQVRIWGSTTDGSGALSLAQIVDVQMASVSPDPTVAH